MTNIFRSKPYKIVSKLLQNNGFNNKEFKDFKIGDVAREVVTRGLLLEFKQIIKQHKMTHFKLLKASLIVLHMLQVSEQMQQNPILSEIIRQLQVRTKAVMYYQRKQINRPPIYSGQGQPEKELQGRNTMKQLCDEKQEHFPQCRDENSLSYLLGKIVLPLLHIEEKVLYSHELIYKPKTRMDSDSCWATLNLLKKYSQFGKTVEQIGRYYQSYKVAMVCTIRVLSLDIRILYRRVADYLKKECAQLHIAIELNNPLACQTEHEEKIKEVIMLVQELQKINQNVRILYCNKYFCDLLVLNHIYMPSIFSAGEGSLELMFSVIQVKTKLSRRQSQYRQPGLIAPPKLNKTESFERVESV